MAKKPQQMQDFDPEVELENEAPNVTPEEQKQYDAFVLLAMELLYDEKRLPSMVERLRAGSDNISEAIGHAAAMTMMTISRSAEQNGQTVSEEIMMHAAGEIVTQISDIAEAAGIITEENSQKIAEAAIYEAFKEWGETWNREGRFTDDKKLEAQEDLKQAGITYKRAPEQEAQLQQLQQGAQGGPAAPEQAPPTGGIVNQMANQG